VTELPSLDLVRRLTDQHVLDQLLAGDQLTRAELAARTGISKPTISESVRRLSDAGLLVEAGAQVGGRGRAGTYVRIDPGLGVVLTSSAGPDGVVVEVADLRGTPVGRELRPVPSPTTAAELGPVLVAAVDAALPTGTPVLAATLSLAGPVDQDTGRLVALPDSPFVLGELDPRALLGDRLGAGLRVDNDVNWAALAEHREGAATDLDHFAYVYLGPGLGAGLVQDGTIVHGARGLAGEISHVRTTGPDGRSLKLVECFRAWDLLHPGSSAIDLDRLGAVLTTAGPVADGVLAAVAGAIGSLTALLNPAAVLIGGPWSTLGDAAARIAERVATEADVTTDVRLAALGADAPLVGARGSALRLGRAALLSRVP
jgi:predicted NBD/HSP70 family sugar kinase/biotin operon repressor